MNLYLISQTDNDDYDTYDAAVVAANSEEDARNTHPDGTSSLAGYTWTARENVSVKLIGRAKGGTIAGVILASFNSG